MRNIDTHKVNGLNDELDITVVDEPGHGGACHCYLIGNRKGLAHCINFQDGPIAEEGVGINGVSNEALLAVVRDRLEGFQSGDYACGTNALALTSVISAMEALKARTVERIERGVEGTHKV